MSRPPTLPETYLMFGLGMAAGHLIVRAVQRPRRPLDLHGQPVIRLG
jgi:hypothetical protein